MANSRNSRIVEPIGEGWSVRAPESSRASFVCADRLDALSRARRIVRNAGGGEVRILGEDGSLIARHHVESRGRASRADLRVS